MKFYAEIIKKDGTIILRPLHSNDEQQMGKLKQNVEYSFEVKGARNPAFHNKVLSLFRLGFENQEQINNFDNYRKVMIMKAGFYDAVQTSKGTVYLPQSIAFDKMDQQEYEDLFERVLDVISAELGTASELIVEQLNSYG